jgi:hypothetical protein
VPAVRQKLHLSSCADFRDRLYYLSDNPINSIDPTGLQGIRKFIAVCMVYFTVSSPMEEGPETRMPPPLNPNPMVDVREPPPPPKKIWK